MRLDALAVASQYQMGRDERFPRFMRTVFVSVVLLGSVLIVTACRESGRSTPQAGNQPGVAQEPAHAPDAETAKPGGAVLPSPADYPAAGPNCRRKINLSPWVGTPGVDWPKTYQCVLTIHTCDGVKTYKSAVRPGGTGMCDDYWKVHDAMANREICCGGS